MIWEMVVCPLTKSLITSAIEYFLASIWYSPSEDPEDDVSRCSEYRCDHHVPAQEEGETFHCPPGGACCCCQQEIVKNSWKIEPKLANITI